MIKLKRIAAQWGVVAVQRLAALIFLLGYGQLAFSACLEPPDASVSWVSPTANAAVGSAPRNVVLIANGSGAWVFRGITFWQGATLLGSGVATGGGNYTFTMNGLNAGSYTIKAQAKAGTPGCIDAVAEAVVTFTVQPAANQLPAVSLSQPANGAVVAGPTANIALAATASDSDGSVTKVEFLSGTTVIGTVTAAPYQFNWQGAVAGTYSLTARATDSSGGIATSAAASVRVNALPTAAVSSSASTAVAPGSFTLAATAADSDGTITQVEFLSNGAVINSGTAAPLSFVWSGVGAGSYSVAARATDSDGQQTTSAPITVTVSANQLPAVSLSQPAVGAVVAGPTASIALAATASDSDGSISKVEFLSGTAVVATVTAAPYAGTWPGVPAGTYSIRARATDNSGGTTTSSAASVTVRENACLEPPDATVAWVGPAANATLGIAPQSVVLTANGAGSWTFRGITFWQGTTLLGQGVATGNGNYTFTLNGLSAGTYTITAQAKAGSPGCLDAVANAVVTFNVSPNQLPSVALTQPTGGAVISGPTGSIALAATANDSDGTISKVEFLSGTTVIGTVTSAPYQFTWSGVAAGTYSLTTRATDDKGGVTTSAAASVRVNALPTATVSASVATAVAPGSFTLAATAADSDGTITQVEFLSNGAVVNTSTAAPYSYVWREVGAGSYSVVARATDSNGQQTTSAPITVTVSANQLPAVSLSQPAIGAVLAGPTASIALAATASDSDGTISKVEFLSGTTVIGTVTAAPYQFNWQGAAAGTYSLTARATDNSGGVATSAAASVRVNALPTAAVSSSATTAVAPGSFTLAATAADSDGTITQVEFLSNGAVINTATAAPYSFVWSAVGAGSYSVAARATDSNGQQTTSAPITVTVVANQLPAVSLSQPVNGAVVAGPSGSIALAATANDSDGTISRVEFLSGTTVIGTVTSAPYQFTWSGVAAGTYSLTARATDDKGGVTTSAAASVRVNALPTATVSSSAGTAVAPGSFTLAATAADSDGTITQVEFLSNGAVINTATAAPYSYAWSGLGTGSYSVAARATDSNGQQTTSAPITVAVSANQLPTVSLSQPANGAVMAGPTASIALAATASDSDGSVSKVEFVSGTTLIATVTAAPYQFTWPGVAAGTYSLTARATDNNGGVTTSAAASVRVNALPTAAVSSSAGTAVAPGSFTLGATAADSDGTITQVEFLSNGAVVNTATAAPYSYLWSGVGAGSYSVTARATDSNGQQTTSAPITVTVSANQLPAVSLSQPANGAVMAGPTASITLAATASDSDGSISKVEFLSGTAVVATITAAPYVGTWSSVPAGTYAISARATDSSGGTTTSSAASVTVRPTTCVEPPDATVAWVGPAANANLGAAPQSIVLTANGSGFQTFRGISFWNGATLLGQGTAVGGGNYTLTMNGLAAGAYTIMAQAKAGATGCVDAVANAFVTFNVSPAPNQLPSVALTQPASGAVIPGPTGTIALAATASDSDGSISKVELLSGTTVIATLTTAPYQFSWTGVAPGAYTLSARATDSTGGVTTSSASSVRVNALPTVSISATSATAAAPASFAFTTSASDADGTITQLEILVNGAAIGSSTTSPYSYTLSDVGAGSYSVVARATDNNNQQTESAPVTLTVTAPTSITPPNVTGALGGTLPGSVSVGPAGAASYAIPLPVPPGTAGMAPDLSLAYSSQGGPGLMGIGWSIGGLSEIRRCAQTIAQDGTRRALELNANDRYCLNGQRLILISGTYGGDAQYRTEVDAFSNVQSFGTDPAKGPDRWQVRTKSGLLLDFGNTPDSSVEAQGKTPVVIFKWAVARVQDRKGNYWAVSYDENTAEGEHYPRQISYTGNSTVAPALIPYAAVRFVYDSPRADPEVEYAAGAKISTLQRLSKVQTFINIAADGSGGTLVRDFQIAYTASSESSRSLVQSLQDCDGAGACLPATTFAWQQMTPTERNFNAPGSGVWGGPVVNYQLNASNANFIRKNVFNDVAMVDLNGDGKTDMLKSLQNGTWQACLSTGTAFDCQTWAGPALKVSDVVLGDFNGDGRTDFLYSGAAGAPIQACLSTGAGFDCAAWPGISSPAAPLSQAGQLVGDFNGDGRDDLAGGAFCYSTGVSFDCAAFTIGSELGNIEELNPICPEEQLRRRHIVGDFNGDGRLDYLVMQQWSAACPPPFGVHSYNWKLFTTVDDGTTRGWVSMGAAPGLPTVDVNSGEATGTGSSSIGPANADAYPDLFLGGLTGGVFKSCRNTGQGFACSTLTTNAATSDNWVHTIADFDGDGRPDAYHRIDDLTSRVCQLSLEPTLSCQTWAQPPSINVGVYGTFGAYGDFNGDGKTDFATYDDANQRWVIQLAGGTRPDLLSQVSNGLGHVTELTYQPLSSSAVYTRDTDAVYPQRDVQDATSVVSQLRVSNAVGGWLTTDYRYGGMKTDLAGRGSLGMRWIEATDQASHVTTRTEFAQTWPYTGMLQRQFATHAPSAVELSRVENTLALKTGCPSSGQLPFVSSSVATGNDLSTAVLPQITTTTQIDCYGNPTNAVVTNVGGSETYTTTSVNAFDNMAASWRIGELRCSQVMKAAPGVASVTRTIGIDYDAFGQVQRETIEPNSGTPVCSTADAGDTYQVKTDYTRDAFGNALTRTLSWAEAGVAKSRKVDDITYETKGRFPQTVNNALNHAETRVYAETHGQMTSLTGPNALATTWEYDSWGRRTLETSADGTTTAWAYKQCQTDCNGGVFATIATPSNAVPSVAYLDSLGRDVRRQSWSFNATEIVSDREYSSLGRLLRVANPRFVAQAPVWTNFTHDDLGRTLTTTDADGVTSVSYNGLDVTTTNAKNQTRKVTRNAVGALRVVTDHDQKTLTYRYEPWGNLDQTTDSKGNLIAMAYDRLGRKLSLADPDLGKWTYKYTPIGDMIEQIDPVRRALSQATTFVYDALRRLTTRTEPDAISTWTYDSCAKGIGKLCQASGANGYLRSHAYDSLGRPASTSVNLDSTYISAFTYAQGRLAGETHTRAALNASTGPAQGFNYVYNDIGYLKEIRSSGGASYWRADETDAFGRITQATLGNGLVTRRRFDPITARLTDIATGRDGTDTVQQDTYHYDALGNLDRRSFFNASGGSVTETFGYDALNRLTSSTIDGSTKTYDYDELGNLTGKTGVGSYAYPASGSASVRPHAVSSVTGTLNGVTNPAFTYDMSGNLLSGAGRTWTWTAANRPKDITQGTLKAAFLYGPERQRSRQTVSNGGTTVKTIDYAGVMEKEVAGSVTQMRTYLPNGAGVIIETTGGSTPGTAVRYFHRDRLGSMNAITDEAGSVVERLAYDAWGRRRNADGTDAATNLTSDIDDTGYTGHEMLDDFGLVHMNGRVYDPTLARVVSADPMLSEAWDMQGFNRYSYVSNSPLVYTDPSGFNKAGNEDPHVEDIAAIHASAVPLYGSDRSKDCLSCVFVKIWHNPDSMRSAGIASMGSEERPEQTGGIVHRPYSAIVLLANAATYNEAGVDDDGVGFFRNVIGEVMRRNEDRSVTPTLDPVYVTVPSTAPVRSGWLSNIDQFLTSLGPTPYAGVKVMAIGIPLLVGRISSAAKGISNAVPQELARVIPGRGSFPTLGPPGRSDVFVTAADDIAGLNATQIAQRLSISEADTFTIIRFPTPQSGLASPINRLDPGFVGGGRTAGGAREFVIPNGPIPAGAKIGVVGP